MQLITSAVTLMNKHRGGLSVSKRKCCFLRDLADKDCNSPALNFIKYAVYGSEICFISTWIIQDVFTSIASNQCNKHFIDVGKKTHRHSTWMHVLCLWRMYYLLNWEISTWKHQIQHSSIQCFLRCRENLAAYML